jgi:hypothetical protein
MNAFYTRVSLADALAISKALEWQEHSHGPGAGATFVEALLAVLGIDAEVNDQQTG